MASERDFGKELDDLKAMMHEQVYAVKEAIATMRESRESRGNNSNKEEPGYDSDDNVNNAIPHNNSEKEVERLKLKQELQESMLEQFRMLRGPNSYGSMSISDLCLAPSVAIPKDFKMPELIKFDGSTNPIMHLRMYCTKMGMWSKDENFLISFFPESLDGAAWEWYMQMDRAQIRCWEDLAQAFTNQYKFNLNAAPTRDQLKGMRKKENESFKEYAQRWKAMAGRVVAPMLEQEMCSYFIHTLEGPFFKNMLGTHVKEFVDLVEIGDRIETNIQEGKVELTIGETSESQSKRSSHFKKKEDDINCIYPQSHQPAFRPSYYLTYQHTQYTSSVAYPPQTKSIAQPHQISYVSYPQPYTPTTPKLHQAPFPTRQTINPVITPLSLNTNNTSRPPMENRPLPHFHMSNVELFKHLCGDNLLVPRPGKTFVPPYPRWYNPNQACDYHSNSLGHSVEDCYGFRNAVWRLINNEAIKLEEEPRPSIP